MSGIRNVERWVWTLAVLLIAGLGASPAWCSTGSPFWGKSFGDVYADQGASVAVDGAGDIYLTGTLTRTFVVSAIPMSSEDMLLAKFAPDGTQLWNEWFGDADPGGFHTYYPQVPVALALDPSGNIYVTGSFQGDFVLGATTLSTGGPITEVYLAKFTPDGVPVWARAFSGFNQDGLAVALAADASGVFMTGYFVGSVDFGGGSLTSAGGRDIFLAKYDPTGTYSWSKQFGESGQDDAADIALDSSGNAVLTGYVAGSLSFDPPSTPLTYHGGNYDVFLAKFTTGGAHVWSELFGGSLSEYGRSLAIDPSGNIALTGSYVSATNLGGGTISTGGTQPDVFLARYDANGNHQWSRGFPGDGVDEGLGAATDNAGNVFITGYFGDIIGATGYTLDLGGSTVLSSGGEGDVFVAKFDSSGVTQWGASFGGTTEDRGLGIAVDGSGRATVTGYYQGTVNAFSTPLVSAGDEDIFLGQFGPDAAEPAIRSIVDVGNDQGRHVKIAFGRSGVDEAGATAPVIRYDVYRRDDPPPAGVAAGPSTASNPAPARTSTPSPAGASGTPPDPALVAQGWLYTGSVPAHGETGYIAGAPTVGDSTIANGQYYSAFLVRAVTGDAFTFYDSPVDSGYSVDNLTPAAPSGFLYSAGQLSWDASTAPDFDHFTVYGSSHETLDAAATAIARTTETHFDASGSPYAYYFVTATDHSGNESQPAGSGTGPGRGNARMHYVLAVNAYPNPFNPETTIRYDVPSQGRVVVRVYDAAGSLVSTLVDTRKDAGSYSVRWDGRDRRGAATSSGVYFVKVTFGSNAVTRKITLLK